MDMARGGEREGGRGGGRKVGFRRKKVSIKTD